jgi:hypothetical protein
LTVKTSDTGPDESARWPCTVYCTLSGPAMNVVSVKRFTPVKPRKLKPLSPGMWRRMQHSRGQPAF